MMNALIQDGYSSAMQTPPPSTSVSPAPSQSAPPDVQQPPSPQKDGKPRREGILLRDSPACYRQVRDRRNPDGISGSKLKIQCIRFIATSSMMKCPTGEVNQERVFIKGDIVDAFVPPTTNLFTYEDDVWIVVTKSKKGPTKLWKRRFSEIKSCVDINFCEIHESDFKIIELGKVNRNPKIKQPTTQVMSSSSPPSSSPSSQMTSSSSSSSPSSWMPSVSFERGESLCFKVSPVNNKFLWVEAGLFSVYSADDNDISGLFASVVPPAYQLISQPHMTAFAHPNATLMTSAPLMSLSPAPVTMTSTNIINNYVSDNNNGSSSINSISSSSLSSSVSAHSIALHEALLNLCEELLYTVDDDDDDDDEVGVIENENVNESDNGVRSNNGGNHEGNNSSFEENDESSNIRSSSSSTTAPATTISLGRISDVIGEKPMLELETN